MTPPRDRPMTTVLLIEDDALSRKLATLILQGAGYEVLSAATAEDGVALARERQPPVALLDIHLPGMDGVAAARALRDDARTCGMHLVAVTASVMREDRPWIMTGGFDGFLAKPFRRGDLLATVGAALNRRGAP